MNYSKNKKSGLSLTELVITIAIMSVIIVTMASFFVSGLMSIKKSQALIPAYTLGEEELEKMRRYVYEDLSPSSETTIKRNGIDYKVKSTCELIYGTTGQRLVKVTMNINWEALREQGKKSITMESYIYTQPTVIPSLP